MKNPHRFLFSSMAALAALTWNAQAALWLPSELSLAAWYDASDADTITTDVTTGNVTDWADKSGNGVHLTQATDTDRPSVITSGMNGLNVLEFAGRTEELDATKSINASWVVVVLQYNNASPLFATALGGVSAQNYTVQYRGDVDADRWQGSYYTNGNSSSTWGASVITNPTIVMNGSANLSNFLLEVGGDRGLNNRGWDGYIAEVIYGTTALTTDERQTLEGYLAHKWMGAGTSNTLDALHPYKDTAPVPEPSALLLSVLGSLLLLRRRR